MKKGYELCSAAPNGKIDGSRMLNTDFHQLEHRFDLHPVILKSREVSRRMLQLSRSMIWIHPLLLSKACLQSVLVN